MKKKPTSIKINLLPKDPFFSTIPGRILKWALSAGRYVVIATELVVIVSFATRFTLDRQVTDLNDSIASKESIIKSYGELEQNFRTAQEKISSYQQIYQESNIVNTFADIREIIPDGIVLDNLVINTDTIIVSGQALTQTAFNLLVNNVQLSDKFHEVSVDRVESNDNSKDLGFTFSLRAKTRIVEKKAEAKTNTEKVDVLDRTGGL
ncbi:MAG: PilN domain-containing protein [Pseudomonadales bacterium]|nr:PilN domain-containing protein [Pseudomonadales bacterium]